MLDWLFGKKKEPSGSSRDYSRLVPRIASTIEIVLEFEGPAALLDQHSMVILNKDYSVGWYGGAPAYVLKAGELAFVYLHECPDYQNLREAIDLARAKTPFDVGVVLKQSVDVVATQIGFRLRDRAKAQDLNL